MTRYSDIHRENTFLFTTVTLGRINEIIYLVNEW